MIYDRPWIDRVYRRSPIGLQHLWVTAYGLIQKWERSSPAYRAYAAELEQTQWWTPAQLQALQQERLQALIRHAYENVPYYRRLFTSRGLRPADLRRPDDLYKLPVLTKQQVRQHWDELRARNLPARRATMGRTGGTTGVPLHFLLDKARVAFDHALIHRHWSWAGFRPGDHVVFLRGFTLVPPEERSGVYWRYDWMDNRIYLSGFHLSLELLPLYVSKLGQWKPGFLSAYPSNVFVLARYMESQGLQRPMRAVFTSSEVLTPAERSAVESRFQCQVWDRYGAGERLAVAQQCGHGSYHQNVEFGLLQVDSPRGSPAAAGSKGELIHTGLTNFSMPLIRYASEDVGYLRSGECPCGRGLPLMGAVEGRKDDVIVTAEGRLMPRAGLDQIHEYVDNMERCQLYQEKIGEIVVRVLPRAGFNDRDASELIAQLRKRVGCGTEIRVELVPQLSLSPTGKQRFIVSRVSPDEVTGLPLELTTDYQG